MAVDLLNLSELETISNDYLPDGSIEVVAEFVNKSAPSVCPSCGGAAFYKHGVRRNKYADIPIEKMPVSLVVEWSRYRCRQCRAMTTPFFEFIDEKRRATTRLVDWVRKKCLDTTFSNLAKQTGLAVNTIKNIALDLIAEIEANIQITTPILLGLSEISMGGKPRSVITNLATRTIFNILEGTTPDFSVNSFKRIPDRENIEWVCLAQWSPFTNLLGDILPNARLVIDKAHVVRMALDAMEEVVRKYLTQTDAEIQPRIKNPQAKIFSYHSRVLSASHKKELSALRESFPVLVAAYDCKEAFARLYEFTCKEEAISAFAEWRERLPVRELEEFHELADMVQKNFEGVFAYWDAPTGLIDTFTEVSAGVAQKLDRIESGYSFEVLRAKMMYKDYAQIVEKILADPSHNRPQHGAYVATRGE